jgi:hypothetical protein
MQCSLKRNHLTYISSATINVEANRMASFCSGSSCIRFRKMPHRYAQKCNFFSRKTNEACCLVINGCSSCGIHHGVNPKERAIDMAIFIFFALISISRVSFTMHIRNAENKSIRRKKIVSNLFFLWAFYPPLLLFINVIRLIANSV